VVAASPPPLLLEHVGPGAGDYTVRAIGETQLVGASNIAYTDLPFNVQAGDSQIYNASYFFGWKDGGQTFANQGVIPINGGGGGLPTPYLP
jgi:hypothetical protein